LLVGLVLRTRSGAGGEGEDGVDVVENGMEGDAGMEVEVDTEETP
jgi:hypothetical protein